MLSEALFAALFDAQERQHQGSSTLRERYSTRYAHATQTRTLREHEHSQENSVLQ
jgi:hypothetical protein